MPVDDSSIKLSVAQRPARFRAAIGGGKVTFVSSPLQVTAQCKVLADAHGTRPPNIAPGANPETRTIV